MAKIKVTQIRSIIGQQDNQKKTLESLGLRKIGKSSVRVDNACTRGMINKISHLVSYELLQDDKG